MDTNPIARLKCQTTAMGVVSIPHSGGVDSFLGCHVTGPGMRPGTTVIAVQDSVLIVAPEPTLTATSELTFWRAITGTGIIPEGTTIERATP